MPCEQVIKMWENDVGTSDSWAPEDSKETKRLLKKLAEQVPSTSKKVNQMLKLIP